MGFQVAQNAGVGPVTGSQTSDNAAAGKVGEYISSVLARASGISMTTTATPTITSIGLTPGDWDVTGILGTTGTLTGTIFQAAIGVANNTLPASTSSGNSRVETASMPTAVVDSTLVIPAFRVSLNASATYYLVGSLTFTVGTATGYGRISARRTR